MSRLGQTGHGASGTITVVLGIMLLLTALSLVFRRRFLALVGDRLDRLPVAQTGWLTVLVGLVLGVVVTISSVGAGALGVTALLILYPRMSMAVIVGSDIAHAVPLTLVAGAGHWFLGSVDWMLLNTLLVGSVPGIILGGYLSARVPDVVLRPILAVTLCVVGGRLLF
jgi:LPXTG-motif cell wall-anchored protein